eukprot:2653286-Alexandrium_andersonii.AAC.1
MLCEVVFGSRAHCVLTLLLKEAPPLGVACSGPGAAVVAEGSAAGNAAGAAAGAGRAPVPRAAFAFG